MKIKILRNTFASGVFFGEGDVVEAPKDISEPDAAKLVNMRKACLVPPKGLEETAPADEKSTDGEEKKPEEEVQDKPKDNAKPNLSSKRSGRGR